MPKVRVGGFAISLDGLGAGVEQSLEHPLGRDAEGIFGWFFRTKAFREMHGGEGGETGIDHDFGLRGMSGFGAFILGRNMFGPVRGPWPDDAGRVGGVTIRRSTRLHSS